MKSSLSGAPWPFELDRYLNSWPAEPRTEFLDYWRALRASGGQAGVKDPSVPAAYWLALPGWLACRYRADKRAPLGDAAGFLPTLLWGQYALFIAIRIQDDLFDGQARSHSLIFASSRFLSESAKCFVALCGSTPGFWNLYSECLGTTIQAILETDRMQRGGECPAGSLLPRYADVGSIFKVGSGAVCLMADRSEEFSHVSRFCDEMAKVSQVFDDLEDVREDLARGRLNFVARFIGLNAASTPDDATVARFLEEWLGDIPAQTPLLCEIRRHIALAEEAVSPLDLSGVTEYLLRERHAADSLERILRTGAASGLGRELFRPGGISSLFGTLSLPGWSV